MQDRFIKIRKMKFLSLLTVITLVCIISGCGSNSTEETLYIPKDGTVPLNTGTSTDTTGIVPENTIIAPEFFPGTPSTITTQNPAQTISTGEKGLNPEHGKPGHRCELAVGAPLNSPAQQPANPPATFKPSISPQPETKITNSKPVAAGMNPEHGKPGHRCDIGVGSPLDSKPADSKTTEQPASTKPNVPVSTPISPLLPASTKPVVAGMNPEHGKPGHKCEIAVGAPLPKQ